MIVRSEGIAPIKTQAQVVLTDGTTLRFAFTSQLISSGHNQGFSYQQTQDGLNIGLQPTDYNFCAGLKDTKHLNAEEVLNKGNLEQLNQELVLPK